MRQFERSLMLQTLDHHWREHLASLDHLRQGIHLRGYAQKNPKQEYKREAFELFSDMLDRIKQDVVKVVLTVRCAASRTCRRSRRPSRSPTSSTSTPTTTRRWRRAPDDGDVAVAPPPPFTRAGDKVGRNDPCPCGSGKKYKHCHGKICRSKRRPCGPWPTRRRGRRFVLRSGTAQ